MNTQTPAPQVPLRVAVLAVEGMTCAACVARLEKVLRRRPGVAEATVSLTAERADIRFDPALIDEAALAQTVEAAGFQARPWVEDEPAEDEAARAAAETRRALLSLSVAAALSAPLLADMFLMLAGSEIRVPGRLQLILATPVQFWIGARFYLGAWASAKSGDANMDTLVTLGTSAAYFYSVWLVGTGADHHGGHLHFEASALVITFVVAGKWLESRARRAAGSAVDALKGLRPETARRLTAGGGGGLTADGGEEVIPLKRLRPGDMVRVLPGERLPADGVTVAGVAAVDESLLTGESRAREKGPGDRVTGGALNLDGRLDVRVEAVGADAALGKMIALVGRAQADKPPIQRLADKAAGVFAFIVAGVALLTFAVWLWWTAGDMAAAILPAVAVLVVACPCALGLATPAVLATALGAAARAGILIRDASALETAHRVDIVVFDKTGTLTEDRPEVAATTPLADLDAPGLIALAAAAQHGGNHPIARALADAAAAQGLAVAEATDFRIVAGRGVIAAVGGRRVAVGNRNLMRESGVDLAAPGNAAGESAAAWEEGLGRSALFVAAFDPAPRLSASCLLGVIGLADRVRPQSDAAVRALTAMGIETLLLTGDAAPAANAVGRRVGVSSVQAQATPEDKIEAIRRLQAAGRVTAMVGDGVNDGPALAQADLGLAMGGGTDVALAAAGFGLMRDDPLLVPASLQLARAARRKIIGNLAWAFGFNAVMIPLAATGALSPVLAALAMSLSSLAVVGNALLLQRWRPDVTLQQSFPAPEARHEHR
jgi:P-type Cu+ transporter